MGGGRRTYDLAARWEPIGAAERCSGEIQGPRIKNHTAALVGNCIYVFGGYDGRHNHNSVYEFDCDKLSWRELEVTGKAPAGRNGHTATYADGKLYILGGWLGSGPLAADDLYVLDLHSLAWSKPNTTGTGPGACNMHTTDFVPSRRSLFVFRGGDGRRYLSVLHMLDIDRMKWSLPQTRGKSPAARANHSSALVGKSLYIFGGWDGTKRLNDIHVLCTENLTWSEPTVHGHPPSPRAGMSLTAVGTRLFLFGGSGPQAACFNDLQVFDTETNCWLITARECRYQSMSFSSNASSSNSSRKSSSSHKSSSAEDDRQRRESMDAGSDDERAPDTAGSGPFADAIKLDAEADPHRQPRANPNAILNSSRKEADLLISGSGPPERAGHTATLVGRRIVVFGGSYKDRYLNDMVALDTDREPDVQVSEESSSLVRLQGQLRHYFDSEEFSDVTFEVESRTIRAHRMILTLASERFARMFDLRNGAGFKEAQQRCVIIPDEDFATFYTMLEYLYTGHFKAPARLAAAAAALDGGAARAGGESSPRSLLDRQWAEGPGNDAELIEFYVDMLGIADRFLLDHLKQLCELQLVKYVRIDTLDMLTEAASMWNAPQLLETCLHRRRNAHLHGSAGAPLAGRAPAPPPPRVASAAKAP